MMNSENIIGQIINGIEIIRIDQGFTGINIIGRHIASGAIGIFSPAAIAQGIERRSSESIITIR